MAKHIKSFKNYVFESLDAVSNLTGIYRKGDKGENIKTIQQTLISAGFLKISTPNGSFGPKTYQAVKDYQKSKGLKPDGIVGPLTIGSFKGVTPTAPKKTEAPKTTKSVKTEAPKKTPSPAPKATPAPKPTEAKKEPKVSLEKDPNLDNLKVSQATLNYWKGKHPLDKPLDVVKYKIKTIAKTYMDNKFPKRIAYEIAYVAVRPEYTNKNAFIIDTRNHLIYLFDKNQKFIAKDVMISGASKQSQDAKQIARALINSNEWARQNGYVWKDGNWMKNGKAINYDDFYNSLAAANARFFPKGIYTTEGSMESDKTYAGGSNNSFKMRPENGKQIGHAIHGFFKEKPREEALAKAKKLLDQSQGDNSVTNPQVSNEFIQELKKGGIDLTQSFGCINLNERFLKYLRQYGANSYVFNIGEDATNYLVKTDTKDYFDGITTDQSVFEPPKGPEQSEEIKIA